MSPSRNGTLTLAPNKGDLIAWGDDAAGHVTDTPRDVGHGFWRDH